MGSTAARLVLGAFACATGAGAACDPSPPAKAQGQAAPGPGSAAAGCYLRASDATDLLTSELFALCQGALTPGGPVQCFLAAEDRLSLTTADSVRLCQCATSTEPVDCWETLDGETTLLSSQIEQLCVPRVVQGLLPNCRAVGYPDGY
jgi:hypothetical protein